TASLGAAAYTFQFDLNADGVADQKVTFANVPTLPATVVLTKASPGTATSSPSTALGGLGDVGWTGSGKSEHTLSFSSPVSSVGLVYRSASALKLVKTGSAGVANYPVSYTLTDGTVVNLGAIGVVGATLTGGANTFVGVIDSTGKGIVSISLRVTGSVSGAGQSFIIDDLGFSVMPEPAVANPINLRSAHDFRVPANITASASAQLAGLASLADFRALAGRNRHVYSFNTWPQAASSLGANTYTFPFDLDGNGTSDQSVTASSSSGALLAKTVLGAAAASPDNVLGGLGDIGGAGGNASHTFSFLKPVSAVGLVYRLPVGGKLQNSGGYPVSYTLTDGTVVNLGAAGALGATLTAGTNTFVGVIDNSGKGITSFTARIQGSGAAGVQNAYIDDLAFVVAGPPPGNWTLTLDENFSGTALNTALWSTGPRWTGIINSELQAYVPENVSVANGLCTLKVEKRTAYNTNMDGYVVGAPASAYASGMIQTYNKWTQTYGYFEARIRMATGKGTWPAFWLLPDRGAGSPNTYYRAVVGDSVQDGAGVWWYPPMGNEIDIMEYMATWKIPSTGLSKSHSGYIWGPSGSGKSWSNFSLDNDGNGPAQFYYDSPDTQFHTYAAYWGPGKIVFYIDGKVVLQRNDPANVSIVPEYL
ncbi:MAG TPA: glycoside hydrolase family 16 protein, partial [Rariglobus sp.]